jgi:hypothetical protein
MVGETARYLDISAVIHSALVGSLQVSVHGVWSGTLQEYTLQHSYRFMKEIPTIIPVACMHVDHLKCYYWNASRTACIGL